MSAKSTRNILGGTSYQNFTNFTNLSQQILLQFIVKRGPFSVNNLSKLTYISFSFFFGN